ncbi:hypothetical protein DRF60_17085 [Chryseobacterium elymi]|uniref:Uncharacterized protein n=2 Tax=Chryseobacterium elymi TaxID=395936 RepID=A0A3D9D9F5_9FLAO|nr:hypothetical protein DRF60_17085 [Chryseobacterium elymi]
MPIPGTHMKNHKALIMMLILVFSLSPCSVKRDFLGIFDIQHISGLNKVKITAGTVSICGLSADTSSVRTILSKADTKFKSKRFLFSLNAAYSFGEEKIDFNQYSGQTSGNSPPKYILFKRLKLDLA